MDWKKQNVKSYDDNAAAFDSYFNSFGARVSDIHLTFRLASLKLADRRVVEIGCGGGRDAKYIVKHCGWYQGFDPSKKFLEIARDRVPDGDFVLADASSYEYPADINVVFAFASLLHVNKDDLKIVLQKLSDVLQPGGVIFISLKEAEKYTEKEQVDKSGSRRMFYHYNPTMIQSMNSGFIIVYEHHYKIDQTDWCNIILKKL